MIPRAGFSLSLKGLAVVEDERAVEEQRVGVLKVDEVFEHRAREVSYIDKRYF